MSIIQDADSEATPESFIENVFNPKLKQCIGCMGKDKIVTVEFYIADGGDDKILLKNLRYAIGITKNSDYYDGINFAGDIAEINTTVDSGNSAYPYMVMTVGYKLRIVRLK